MHRCRHLWLTGAMWWAQAGLSSNICLHLEPAQNITNWVTWGLEWCWCHHHPPVKDKMTPIGQKWSTSGSTWPLPSVRQGEEQVQSFPCGSMLGAAGQQEHLLAQGQANQSGWWKRGEAACCHGAGTCTVPGQMVEGVQGPGGAAGCPTRAGWCLCLCEQGRSSILVGMQGRSGREVRQGAAGRMCPIPRAHLAPAASCTILDPIWFAEPNPLSSSLNLSLTTLASSELYITAWGQACVIKKSWWSLRDIK